MTTYIYARVSTDGQSTDAQSLALKKRFPGAELVSEVASGAKQRPMLRALVEQLQSGDQLVVAALDRLGRRTSEVLQLIEKLEHRRVVLISVREGVDYSTPVGRLVTQILVSVSEMERSLIAERTKAGLAAARAKGRFGGRPPVVTDAQRASIDKLANKYSHRHIAKKVGVSSATVARHLKRARTAPPATRRDKTDSAHTQKPTPRASKGAAGGA